MLALALSAWFGLAWYQASRTGKAQALVAGRARLPAAEARHARSLLDGAGTLNPDLTVTILRGELAAEQHRYGEAIRLLRSAAAQEPENLNAWIQLVFVAGRAGERRLASSAGHHVSELIPRVRAQQ